MATGVEQWLLDHGTRFGYPLVFLGVGVESLGVPVPGETTLLVAAVLAGRGTLNWFAVGAVAWAAAVLGDNSGYWIGRRLGTRLMRAPLLRHAYTPERLVRVEAIVARHGWYAVFLGRFVALLRIFAGPLAGMHHMPWGRFLLANAAGGLAWVTAVLAVGYTVGRNLDRATRLVTDAGWIGLGVVAVVAVVIAVVVVRQRRRHR